MALIPIGGGCKSSGNSTGAGAGTSASGDIAPVKLGPSGVPEITVRASENALRSAITDFFDQRGYAEAPSRFTDELVFDRPIGDSEAARNAARVRLRYGRLSDGRWRVVAIAKAVESWKTALESERTVTSAAKQMQGFLNVIKANIETQS